MNPEQVVKDFLSGYGLRSEKFDKTQIGIGKTPDFRIFINTDLVFYCEVKNAQKDMWLDEKIAKADPGEIIVGGIRKDPVFNRLSAHIHKAHKQFDAVNKNESLPNVLAFYNEDKQSGFLDLLAVTTGNFYAEGGEVYPIYKNFSEGRIKADIEKIHLIIWLDVHKPYRFMFNLANNRFQNELCSIFEYDPKQLEIVHP